MRKGLVKRKIIDKARRVMGVGERLTRMHYIRVWNCQRKGLIIKEEEKFIHYLLESLIQVQQNDWYPNRKCSNPRTKVRSFSPGTRASQFWYYKL